jgi:HK97 family phage major capsid protein
MELKELLEAIKALKDQIAESVTAGKEETKVLTARLAELEGKLAVAQTEATKAKEEAAAAKAKADKLEAESIREPDAAKRGRILEMLAAGSAPGRVYQRGSGGWRLTNVWRAVIERNTDLCKAEMEVSKQLLDLGYPKESESGMLIPLAIDGLSEKHQDLAREISQKMSLGPGLDYGEAAWHLKRNPSVAKAFGLETKDLEIGDDTLGGILVPVTQADRIIDFLRGRSVLTQAGAREIPLPPTGNITYPRFASDPTFTWTDPDSTTDATPSTPTFGAVRLQAKSLRGYVTIPNDLIRYSTPGVELIVRAALGGKAAVAEDNQYLEGVGSSLAPRGLTTYPRSTAETPTALKLTYHVAKTVAANGDTFEPEDVALMMALYEESLDPDPPTAWIMRPTMFAVLANRRADAVSANDAKGPFMFPMTRGDLGADTKKVINGIRAFTTTQLSRNFTKGSSSTLNAILHGNFQRMLIGRSGVLELAVSTEVKFLQDKTVLKAILRGDMGLEHEQSFVITMNCLQA